MTLANQLTILRMCLVPVLVILVIYGSFGWALVIFLIAGVTDALDGLIARLKRERTSLGAMLDPLADKLLITASLVVLTIPDSDLTVRIPAWITIFAISRDTGIVLSVLLVNIAVGRRILSPTPLGKATTFIQLVTVLWVFWCNYRGTTTQATDVLLGLMFALTLVSGLHYVYYARKFFGEEKT